MGNRKQATRSKGGQKQKDFDLMQIFKSPLSVCVVPFRETVFKLTVSEQSNSSLVLDGRLN
jgi:hypothetical protein